MWRSDASRLARVTLAAAALASGGCVEVALHGAREPFDYAALPAPPAGEPSEGAIWPGETPSGSFLFFDQKARGVGDLLTVRIVERISAEGEAQTDLESSSSLGAQVTSDVGFQDLVAKPVIKLLDLIGVGPDDNDVSAGSALNVAQAESDSRFEGEGSTRREGSFDAVLTCRVLAVLPGDVFHIRGRRALVVNHELQYLTVEGLVRKEDVGIDNVVASSALAEARITLDGIGVIDDRQRPGWMTRVFSWLYPF